MLTRLASLGIRYPRRVLAIAGLLFVLAGLYGFTAADHLSSGGFRDPHAASSRAEALLQQRFHSGATNLVVEVSSPQGVDSAAARAAGLAAVRQIRTSPYAYQIASYWTVPAAPARPTGEQGQEVGAGRGERRRLGLGRAHAGRRGQQAADRHARRRDRQDRRLRQRLRPGQRPDEEGPRHRRDDHDPAHGDRADLGVRQPARLAAPPRRRAVLDRGDDGDPARAGGADRRVDLLAEHDDGDGPGAGHRLQPVRGQPLPRGDPRRRDARGRRPAHDADGRTDGAVLGDDRRAVAGRAAGVPRVLPALVRLRRRRGGRARDRGRAGAAAGDADADGPPGRRARPAGRRAAAAAPSAAGGQAGRAELLVPLRHRGDAPRAAGGPAGHRRAGRAGAAVPARALRLPRRPGAAAHRVRPPGRGRRPYPVHLERRLDDDGRGDRHQRRAVGDRPVRHAALEAGPRQLGQLGCRRVQRGTAGGDAQRRADARRAVDLPGAEHRRRGAVARWQGVADAGEGRPRAVEGALRRPDGGQPRQPGRARRARCRTRSR